MKPSRCVPSSVRRLSADACASSGDGRSLADRQTVAVHVTTSSASDVQMAVRHHQSDASECLEIT